MNFLDARELTQPKELFLCKYEPGLDGFELTAEVKKGLERRINDFFFDRSMGLIAEQTESLVWKNLKYIVTLEEIKEESEVAMDYDSIMGILLASKARTRGGFEFMLYKIIGIDKDERGNGHLRKLIECSRLKSQSPAGLRTSDKSANKKYAAVSDYPRIIRTGGSYRGEKIDYNIHLFGSFPQAKINEVADYIASLPPNFRKIGYHK